MKKQKKQEPDWPEQVQELRVACWAALEDLAELEEEYRDGEDIEGSLKRFRDELDAVYRLSDRLHETMCVIPIRKMFSVDRINITEREYHLTRAAGFKLVTAKGLGICPLDDFDVYRMCVYEDDKMVCFLNPDESPKVKTVDKKTGVTHIRLRIARSPEELEAKHLGPEQRQFFTKYRPDVLARLKGD